MTSEPEDRWLLLRENATGFAKLVLQDGEQIHIQVLGALEEKDGSRHVLYDVLWSSMPQRYVGQRGGAFEAAFEDVVSVEPLSREEGNEYLKRQSDLRI